MVYRNRRVVSSVAHGRSEMIVAVITPVPPQVRLRRATVHDVPALVHLRSLMFSSMGSDVGGQDAPWRGAAAGWFREQLDRPEQFAGFVIEHPDEGVVSAALGSCDVRAPSPHNVSGAHGRVFNISTEPAHRRCGYGRACLTALLSWFDTDTGVRVVDSMPPPTEPACTSRPAPVNPRFPRCGCTCGGRPRADLPGAAIPYPALAGQRV
jgi:GNAT superfamily N-acetyltransferase